MRLGCAAGLPRVCCLHGGAGAACLCTVLSVAPIALLMHASWVGAEVVVKKLIIICRTRNEDAYAVEGESHLMRT